MRLDELSAMRGDVKVLPRADGVPPLQMNLGEPEHPLVPAFNRGAERDRQGAYELARTRVPSANGGDAILLAALAMEAGQFDDSIERLENVLRGPAVHAGSLKAKLVLAFTDEGMLVFQPSSLAALALLILAYAKADRYDDAIALAAAAYAAIDSAAFLVIHMVLLREVKEWHELLAVGELRPADDVAHFEIDLMRGQALEELGRESEAVALYGELAALRADERRKKTVIPWLDHAIARSRRLTGVDEIAREKALPYAKRAGGRRWIGDLKRCFLLERGWSFRVPINRFLLRGRAWPLPVTVAEAMGLQEPGGLDLRPMNGCTGPPITVSRTAKKACSVGAIDRPLRELKATDGDVAFFCFRETRYRVVVRRRIELNNADPVGQLLWHCGIDPSDDHYRRDLWHRLSMTLGGSGATRRDVLQRIEARRDRELLELLALTESAQVGRSAEWWPDGWQYIAPLDEHTSALALLSSSGERRVALGVVDVSGQPGKELIVTDGGLAWVEGDFDPTDPSTEISRRLPGLIPAALKPEWNRWVRTEHRLRLGGLRGSGFNAHRDGDGWHVDGTRADSLLDILERQPPPDGDEPDPPVEPVRRSYPRAALAFTRALKNAEARGLVAIAADRRSGIRASYADGREITSSGLLDVFDPGE
jgi:hypothetical protein